MLGRIARLGPKYPQLIVLQHDRRMAHFGIK